MLCGAAMIAVAGCAPDLGERSQPQAPEKFATTQSFAAPEAAWPEDAWWKAFGDATLDTLMAEALRDSPDLKIAAARIRAAEASSDVAGADLWPTIGLGAGLQETEQSLNTGYPESFRPYLPRGWHHAGEISTSLQYQLDFFGKYRAAASAAGSMAAAAHADSASARLQLTAAVATAYASLMQVSAGRTAAAAMLNIQQARRELTAQRVHKGLDNAAALHQAEAGEADAAGDLAKVDRLVATTRHQLAALIGAGPDRGLAIVPSQDIHPVRSVGLPKQVAVALLGRRPDVVAARLNAMAAASSIDGANANFYPNVDLTGMFGVQALDAGLLIQGTSEFGKFGPAITLPLFDYGRLTGVYRKARADYDAAVATYDKTLTNALREVADDYSNRRGLETELVEARKALSARDGAYGVAKARYRAGLLRRLDLLTAQSAVVAQRRVVAGQEAEIFAADVALIRALGGGYNDKQDKAADVRTQ